jgi:hypothetical protein
MASEIQIKNIPTETYCFILKAQTDMKIKKKCGQYSLSQTVLNLLDELKAIKESKK